MALSNIEVLAEFACGSFYVLEIFRYDPEGKTIPVRVFQKQLGKYAYDFTDGNMVTATARTGFDLAISGITCFEQSIYMIRPLTSTSC